MVYESDFYTTRRPYSRPTPTISSYSVTTPRHYVVTDRPDRTRRADEQYSYSYSAEESKTDIDPTISKAPPSRAAPASSRCSDTTDSDVDLADPYGPYSRFGKYLKKGSSETKKRDLPARVQQTRPPKRDSPDIKRLTTRREALPAARPPKAVVSDIDSDEEFVPKAQMSTNRSRTTVDMNVSDSEDDDDGYYETKFSKVLREFRPVVRAQTNRWNGKEVVSSDDEDVASLCRRARPVRAPLNVEQEESDSEDSFLEKYRPLKSKSNATKTLNGKQKVSEKWPEEHDIINNVTSSSKFLNSSVESQRPKKSHYQTGCTHNGTLSCGLVRSSTPVREEEGSKRNGRGSWHPKDSPRESDVRRPPRQPLQLQEASDESKLIGSHVLGRKLMNSASSSRKKSSNSDEFSAISSNASLAEGSKYRYRTRKPEHATTASLCDSGFGERKESASSSTGDAASEVRKVRSSRIEARIARRVNDLSDGDESLPSRPFRTVRTALNRGRRTSTSPDSDRMTTSSYLTDKTNSWSKRKPASPLEATLPLVSNSTAGDETIYGRIDRFGRYVARKTSVSSASIHENKENWEADQEAQPFQRNLPFVAHKRLTAPQAPPPRSKVRNSVLMAEIDRINHRVRPHPAYVPVEDWLNSACSVYDLTKALSYLHDPTPTEEPVVPEQVDSTKPDPQAVKAHRMRARFRRREVPLLTMANFDDETRSIRAQTAALLKRVHSPIPRSRGPLHAVLPTPSSLMETPIPNRHTSDHYIEGLLAPISKVQRDVASRSFYVEHPRPYIGKGHLACVSFAGGRAYAKRRNHYDVPEDHHNVQDDIATLSYYNRARAVANGMEPGPEPAATSTRKSRPYRSSVDSAPAPAEAPARAAPVRQPSIKEEPVTEDPIAEAAAEAELAASQDAPEAAVLTNGISAEEAEAARLAEEEAELERQLEAELRAEMEAKEAKKSKKAAAKKAAEEAEAKRLAEEAAAAQRVAEEEAAAKAAEEEAAALNAAEEAAAAAKAAEEEEARRLAEEEAEIERQVAAELEAERLAAEANQAEEADTAAPSEEPEVSTEPEHNDDKPEATPEEDDPELELDPTPEPTPESDPAAEPADPDLEAVEPDQDAEAEPHAESEDPVVDEPGSPTEREDADPFDDNGSKAEEIKSDEESGWPLDEE